MANASRLVPAIGLALLWAGSAGAAPPVDAWEPYRFLLGEWVGEGSGQPGQGEGAFSFAFDLQEKVIVRKHRAEIAASAGRPAAVHEDLMVIYQGAGQARAIYFDSEGHVIQYTPSRSSDKQSLVFLSDAVASAPRFRLTYTKRGAGSVQIKFEIAPPGQPDAFKTYVEGTALKRSPAKPG